MLCSCNKSGKLLKQRCKKQFNVDQNPLGTECSNKSDRKLCFNAVTSAFSTACLLFETGLNTFIINRAHRNSNDLIIATY